MPPARVAKRLIDTTATLSTLSERGRIVPELQDPASLRELLVQYYRVICEVSSAEVRILAVIHQARDFPSPQ